MDESERILFETVLCSVCTVGFLVIVWLMFRKDKDE